MAGCCEGGNEHLGSINYGRSSRPAEELSASQKVSASWTYFDKNNLADPKWAAWLTFRTTAIAYKPRCDPRLPVTS